MVFVILDRMCLCGVFCRDLSRPFGVQYKLILMFLCFIFCPDNWSIRESVVLKSPTINELMLIYLFNPAMDFVFMKLGTLEFGKFTFRLVLASWLIVPLIRTKCPSLSLLMSFSLNSILSDFRIARPFYFWVLFWVGYFGLSFYSKTALIFKAKTCFLDTTDRWILFVD